MHPNIISKYFQILYITLCLREEHLLLWKRSSSPAPSVTNSDSFKSNILSHETSWEVRNHKRSTSFPFLTVFRRRF